MARPALFVLSPRLSVRRYAYRTGDLTAIRPYQPRTSLLLQSGQTGRRVIDLHCHLLPGIDDGAKGLTESLEMAKIAVADGITIAACTPHILPGVYNNNGAAIREAVTRLQMEIEKEGIPLLLVEGADVHIAPDLHRKLASGEIPSLGQSRYFLLEPPQTLVPPRFEETLFDLLVEGHIPIITHPERLHWLGSHYPMLERLARSGVWMQLTGGSLLGKFGRRARYWSERMLEEGLAHIIASDAHDTQLRPPRLSDAMEAVTKRVGGEEAKRLVIIRPAGILRNQAPSEIGVPVARVVVQ